MYLVKRVNSSEYSSESPNLHITKISSLLRFRQNLFTSHEEKCNSNHQQPRLNSVLVLSYLSHCELLLCAKIEILMHADACIGASIQGAVQEIEAFGRLPLGDERIIIQMR